MQNYSSPRQGPTSNVLDYPSIVYNGPSLEQVVDARKKHLSAGQYWFYKDPLMLVEAKQQYCWDEKGRKYVDGYSNVCHIGHCHPHVVESVARSMATIVSNTRYLHPTIVQYAEKLKSKFSPRLSVVYFVNSGSEGNDLALRLARIYTNRKPIVCLEHAYHGTTAACTGISNSLSTGTSSEPKDYRYCARDIYTTMVPDPYRGKYKGCDPKAGEKYAKQLMKVCSTMTEAPAAFIHESAQGVGGQVIYPPDFLSKAYDYIHSEGGVCIADEVQTGFGRSGTHFWAFEAQGVQPDIVVMGKPIGNGFPLGAVVCTKEIASAFDDCQYFNTAGGNPVSCAAGLAVLEVIEKEGLQENARRTSLEFMPMLQALKKKHMHVGDVRGLGMYMGIELVRDRKTLEPASEETAYVMERMKHHGVLVGKGGYKNNVIRMKPPLCFTIENARQVCEAFTKVFTELERQGASFARMPQTSQRSLQTYVYAGADTSATAPDELQMISMQRGTRAQGKRYEVDHDNESVADSMDERPSAIRRKLAPDSQLPVGLRGVVEKHMRS